MEFQTDETPPGLGAGSVILPYARQAPIYIRLVCSRVIGASGDQSRGARTKVCVGKQVPGGLSEVQGRVGGLGEISSRGMGPQGMHLS